MNSIDPNSDLAQTKIQREIEKLEAEIDQLRDGTTEAKANTILERSKLEHEIQKLGVEIHKLRSANRRAWITNVSLVVTIIISLIGGWNTLHQIQVKNKELQLESRVKSTEIFLDKVLPRVAGRKTGDDPSRAEQLGAFEIAAELVYAFPELSNPVKRVLAQHEKDGDTEAAKVLKSLGN